MFGGQTTWCPQPSGPATRPALTGPHVAPAAPVPLPLALPPDSSGLSGVHVTFCSAEEWGVLGELGFQQRLGIQVGGAGEGGEGRRQ